MKDGKGTATAEARAVATAVGSATARAIADAYVKVETIRQFVQSVKYVKE